MQKKEQLSIFKLLFNPMMSVAKCILTLASYVFSMLLCPPPVLPVKSFCFAFTLFHSFSRKAFRFRPVYSVILISSIVTFFSSSMINAFNTGFSLSIKDKMR